VHNALHLGTEQYNDSMRAKLVHAFLVSLEWRIIAFCITNVFFWVTTGEFWKAAGLAFILQTILFTAQIIWQFFRNELHTPLIPKRLARAVRKRRFY
jgi:hypothetical protein